MESNLPKLQEPGAGLPPLEELFFRRLLIPLLTSTTSWDQSAKKFQLECEHILTLIDTLPPEKLKERILIHRLPGLEDSSRYWSIAMTLEHLMVVGEGMKKIMIDLSNSKAISLKVSIAHAKPSGQIADIVPIFKRFCRNHVSNIERELGDGNSKSCHPHPWFGPFTAKKWFWLMAHHQSLHRKQMEKIIENLGSTIIPTIQEQHHETDS